jgi:hypothetical protein
MLVKGSQHRMNQTKNNKKYMKLTHGILGCALAAGLVGFATEKAQANDVINNVIYAPLTVKISATFTVGSKSKKGTLTDKVLLNDILEFPKGDKLVVSAETGDVWVITKQGELDEDLTEEGIVTVNTDQTGGSEKGDTETETGTTQIAFYDDPTFFDGTYINGFSEEDSADWFEVTGTYTIKQSEGNVNSKGSFKESDAFTSKDLAGSGRFDITTDDNTVQISKSSVSSKGSGSIED